MPDIKPSLAGRTREILRGRPAASALLLLAAGILSHSSLDHHPLRWIIVAAVLLVIGLLALNRRHVSSACIAGTIFFAGVVVAQLQHYSFPANDISGFAEDQPQLVNLELELTEQPRVLTQESRSYRSLPPRQIVTAGICSVETTAGWQESSGAIMLTVEQPMAQLAAGQRLRAIGMLERPAAPGNPGEFDWASYYRDKRILATFRVNHADAIQMISNPGAPLLLRMREHAARLLAAGFTKDQSLDQAVLAALVLGDFDPRMHDVRDDFNRIGAAYQLSISGLHIAILGGVIFLICRVLRISPRNAVIASALVVAMYSMIALPSGPGIRSVMLCIAVAAGLLSRQALDRLQLLAVCAVMILLWRPLDLYTAGFQISVTAIAAIILLAPPVHRLWGDLFAPTDPVLFAPRKRSPVKVALSSAWQASARLFMTSSVVWAATLPLVCFHFEQFTPWAALAAILVLPFSIIALLDGIAKMVLTALIPRAASLLAFLTAGPVNVLRHAVDLLAHLPGSGVRTPPPSMGIIAFYYLLLLLPLVPWRHLFVRRCACGGVVAALCMLMSLPMVAGFSAQPIATDELQITFLSIGAGQTAIVHPPASSNAGVWFVDAGSSSIDNLSDRIILPYLRSQGLSQVDGILLSHGDYDHISAAGDLFRSLNVPRILVNPQFRLHAQGVQPTEELLDLLDRDNHPPGEAARGERFAIAPNAAIEVLWPPPDCALNSNNCGLVLRLTYGGHSVLFPADIQERAERELLKHPEMLKSDVLVAPHHGSAETTTAGFIAAVAPKYIIASSDRRLTHKQKVFDGLAGATPFFRTGDCGAITVHMTKDGKVWITTFLPHVNSSERAIAMK